MNVRTLFLIIFFLFPVAIFAHITGAYKVSGVDPQTHQKYIGIVIITERDSVYTAQWTFAGGSTDVGTGVRKGKFLSFVFEEDGRNSFGTQLYKIDGHTLKGPWVRIGADKKGFEKIKKIYD